MAGFALYDVQKAIDGVLIGDETLTNMLGDGVNGIVDNGVQSNTLTFPYVVYVNTSSTDFGTKTENGAETFITLSVFSKTGDKEQCHDIMNRIHDLLHRSNLTVSNNSFVLCRWDGLSDIFTDDSEQGRINQGVIRFRVLTSES